MTRSTPCYHQACETADSIDLHALDVNSDLVAIMRMVRDAAAGDPDMADKWAINEQQRVTHSGLLAQLLADRAL